jgi:hypothetical protein
LKTCGRDTKGLILLAENWVSNWRFKVPFLLQPTVQNEDLTARDVAAGRINGLVRSRHPTDHQCRTSGSVTLHPCRRSSWAQQSRCNSAEHGGERRLRRNKLALDTSRRRWQLDARHGFRPHLRGGPTVLLSGVTDANSFTIRLVGSRRSPAWSGCDAPVSRSCR